MARRKARIPQGKKLQPAPLTMTFSLDVSQATQNRFTIDLSQCASLINRRFYRQGLQWGVSGFTVFSPDGSTGSVTIDKIPDTWVAGNAWVKGFSNWQKLNNEALAETESIKPKFLDYKVYMDPLHHLDGQGANLIPIDSTSVQYNLGEWVYSQQIIPATDGSDTTNPFDIIWTGQNYPAVSPATTRNAVSLIEGYAASRALPDIADPNVPDDVYDVTGNTPENWMSATFNEGTRQADAVLADLATENDQAPYPFENDGANADTMYPGGANQASGLEPHDIVYMTPTTVGGKSFLRGGLFSGGLVRVVTDTLVADELVLQVHLAPGSHRGYMCRSMKEV